MTIRKVKSLRDIKVGDYVNLESHIRYGFAGNVGEVISVLTASAVVAVHKQASIEHRTVKTRQMVYVCDTYDEANNMRQASTDAAVKALKAESRLISKLRLQTTLTERKAIDRYSVTAEVEAVD